MGVVPVYISFETDLAITDEEEDDDVLSMQEAIVELPRSSASKRKPRKIFRTPPKKRVAAPSQ